jgi:hypothetical protein
MEVHKPAVIEVAIHLNDLLPRIIIQHECCGNQAVYIEVSYHPQMRQRHPKVALIIRTWLQQLTAVNISYSAICTDLVVRIAFDGHPFFFQLSPFKN